MSDGSNAVDGGSVAVVVPLMAMMILILGGLVIDGGRVLNARAQAAAYAEEAARAGAGSAGQDTFVVSLTEDEARSGVADFCAVAQDDPNVTTCAFQKLGRDADGNQVVHTRVVIIVPPGLLSFVGAPSFTASGNGKARAVVKVLREDGP